ncbi:MAG: cupin domain-containing protein [Bacteroidetes bacterium]|nr:cupin domain-containing protein [Bacteroidota bacterium]
MNTIFVHSENREWESLGSGLRRKILGYDEQLMMVCVEFSTAGAVGALHKHVHRQVTYVAEGVFEVTIGMEKQVLRKGDSFFVPPNVEHGVVALEGGMLIDVFTPAREDFLKCENIR